MADLVIKEFDSLKIKSIGTILFLDGEMKYWTWSPYEKCSYRCVYCSVEAQGKSQPAITREEIPHLLDDYVRLTDNKHPLILGGLADAYPMEERELELTRYALQEFSKRPIRLLLSTHGDMILRDIDILKKMKNIEGIAISIPMHQDDQIKKMEPGAPDFISRVEAAIKLHQAGLPVQVNVIPWIPDISDVETISQKFPAEMKINIGVLSYNEHQDKLVSNLFGREIPSAKRVFGDHYSQAMINEAFLNECKRIGRGNKGNLNWLVLPNSGRNHSEALNI